MEEIAQEVMEHVPMDAPVAPLNPDSSETTASESSDSIDAKENTGRWTQEEHDLFMQGLKIHRKQWKLIAELIKTRTVVQIRTHAQKFFQKLMKNRPTSGEISLEDINSFLDNPVMSTVKPDLGDKAAMSPTRIKRKTAAVPRNMLGAADDSVQPNIIGVHGEFTDGVGGIRVQRSMSLSTFEEVYDYSFYSSKPQAEIVPDNLSRTAMDISEVVNDPVPPAIGQPQEHVEHSGPDNLAFPSSKRLGVEIPSFHAGVDDNGRPMTPLSTASPRSKSKKSSGSNARNRSASCVAMSEDGTTLPTKKGLVKSTSFATAGQGPTGAGQGTPRARSGSNSGSGGRTKKPSGAATTAATLLRSQSLDSGESISGANDSWCEVIDIDSDLSIFGLGHDFPIDWLDTVVSGSALPTTSFANTMPSNAMPGLQMTRQDINQYPVSNLAAREKSDGFYYPHGMQSQKQQGAPSQVHPPTSYLQNQASYSNSHFQQPQSHYFDQSHVQMSSHSQPLTGFHHSHQALGMQAQSLHSFPSHGGPLSQQPLSSANQLHQSHYAMPNLYGQSSSASGNIGHYQPLAYLGHNAHNAPSLSGLHRQNQQQHPHQHLLHHSQSASASQHPPVPSSFNMYVIPPPGQLQHQSAHLHNHPYVSHVDYGGSSNASASHLSTQLRSGTAEAKSGSEIHLDYDIDEMVVDLAAWLAVDNNQEAIGQNVEAGGIQIGVSINPQVTTLGTVPSLPPHSPEPNVRGTTSTQPESQFLSPKAGSDTSTSNDDSSCSDDDVIVNRSGLSATASQSMVTPPLVDAVSNAGIIVPLFPAANEPFVFTVGSPPPPSILGYIPGVNVPPSPRTFFKEPPTLNADPFMDEHDQMGSTGASTSSTTGTVNVSPTKANSQSKSTSSRKESQAKVTPLPFPGEMAAPLTIQIRRGLPDINSKSSPSSVGSSTAHEKTVKSSPSPSLVSAGTSSSAIYNLAGSPQLSNDGSPSTTKKRGRPRRIQAASGALQSELGNEDIDDECSPQPDVPLSVGEGLISSPTGPEQNDIYDDFLNEVDDHGAHEILDCT